MKYRVVKPYTRQYTDPIAFEHGEVISVERQDPDGPEWWWCTDKRGKSGWVHESYFVEDDYRKITTQSYSAWELTVGEGDILDGQRELGGWLLATTEDGDFGWVPMENVVVVVRD